jgi:hypothetical protein
LNAGRGQEGASMDEIEIWRAANVLMIHHGDDDAVAIANGYVEQMGINRDADGLAVWRRIHAALRELQSRDRRSDEQLH